MIPVLKEKFNNSKIIALHADEQIKNEQELKHKCSASLYSADRSEIKLFLEKEIPDIEIEKISIIEWRPSQNYYKGAYVELLSVTAQFLKQTEAGRRTTSVFGKRWFKNFFKNLTFVNKGMLYRQTSLPIIITGSGPSLEQHLPLIAEKQDKYLIIAASSSVMALSSHGIKADIVIATDGGTWALKHFYPAFRNCFSHKQGLQTSFASILAVNLCAALPSQTKDLPFLLINDGSFWQNIVLQELKLPSVLIRQTGTVSAAAAELALLLSSGNIYLAGLDFSVNDIRTHVRPYAFDSLFFSKANMLNPFYTTSFTRSRLLKKGGSLDIYASWFKDQFNTWQKRIFPINEQLSDNGKYLKQDLSDFFNVINVKNESFNKRGAFALLNALKKSEYSNYLLQELSSLLFPKEKNISKYDLENKLREEFEL